MSDHLDHLKDPDAISWEDLKQELGFTPEEQEKIRAGDDRLIAEARASRDRERRWLEAHPDDELPGEVPVDLSTVPWDDE